MSQKKRSSSTQAADNSQSARSEAPPDSGSTSSASATRRKPATKPAVEDSTSSVPLQEESAAPPPKKPPRPRARKTPTETAPKTPVVRAKRTSKPPAASSKAATANTVIEPEIQKAPVQPEVAAAPIETNPLSILMVTPEAHPFAKTGGLAEVAAALPQALAALGHRVTLVLPRYRGIDTAGTRAVPVSFKFGNQSIALSVLEQEQSAIPGVRVAFVEAPDLFDREGLYGDAKGDYPDNTWRFAVLSRAALEYARASKLRPSIIHAHDWQTGLVPVYQKMALSSDAFVGGVPAVFTIHNLAFQGLFPASTVESVGLGWDVVDVQAMEYWGQISYLKAGINFSEKITTVSPTYAQEITTQELGFGFDGILRRRVSDLVGILNGIDTARWNPAADEYAPASFSGEDLSGKLAAKRALIEASGIGSDPRAIVRPLIGLVSRLTDQKGFDLIAASVDELMSLDASWVMLGSGERRYEDLWKTLAARHPGRVSATIGFDERLAHLIEAGADMFLMPSRFEPCGLNQLYSLRYGTIPIVRATGGLKDTVEDAGATGKGTGFTFTQYTPGALVDAVRRGLVAFRNQDLWRAMQRRAMQQDHSWDASAREYVKVYRALTERQGAEAAGAAVGAAPTTN
jgi:starch synthase